MFCSTGIDNFELRLTLKPSEETTLKYECAYRNDDRYSLFEEPKIFLRFEHGIVYANLNAPKLTFGHNVKLAGPEEVETAIRVLEQNTQGVVPRLNWWHAEVSLLHVTHTREVSNFEEYRSLLQAPRGYWEYDDRESFTGDYFNCNRQNLPVCVYDKAEQLLANQMQLPSDIILEMDNERNALFRFEARLNQSPFSQLKKHGGWNGFSFRGEDLAREDGFAPALKYLQWRFERHILVPNLRLPALGKNPSERAYAAHNIRATAYESPERLRGRAIADHRAGVISERVLNVELSRANLLERRIRALNLRSTLAENCEKVSGEFPVAMSAKLKTLEFENVVRPKGRTGS